MEVNEKKNVCVADDNKTPTWAYPWNAQTVNTNCPVTVNFGKLRKMARDYQKDKSVI